MSTTPALTEKMIDQKIHSLAQRLRIKFFQDPNASPCFMGYLPESCLFFTSLTKKLPFSLYCHFIRYDTTHHKPQTTLTQSISSPIILIDHSWRPQDTERLEILYQALRPLAPEIHLCLLTLPEATIQLAPFQKSLWSSIDYGILTPSILFGFGKANHDILNTPDDEIGSATYKKNLWVH